MGEDFMKVVNQSATLEEFIPRYLNQAITYTGEDMGSDRSMILVFLYIIIAILAFVFCITISNTIARESNVIGTLLASGYTRGELVPLLRPLPPSGDPPECQQLPPAVSGDLICQHDPDVRPDVPSGFVPLPERPGGQSFVQLPIYPADAGSVYVSSAYADKCGLEVGDSITLKEAYEDTTYSFTVGGIYDYPGGVTLFLPQDQLNETFDLDQEYFSGYLSDTEITDIDEKYIGSVIDLDSLTKVCRQITVSMGNMMGLVDAFAVILFRAIMQTSANGWIPVYFEPSLYLKMFAMGFGSYLVVAALELRRIRRVPMDMALKNIE